MIIDTHIDFLKVTKEHLEYVRCPLCGNEDQKLAKSIHNWPIVQCSLCDFSFANPRLKESILNGYYAERDNDYDSSSSSINDSKNIFFNILIDKMIKVFDPQDTNINFAEIGSGDGNFLKLLEQRTKWNIVGYEPCSNIESPSIISADFMVATVSENTYDIIFSASVIEHIYHPKKMFEKVFASLKKGGAFMSTGIPNITSFANMVKMKDYDSDCPPTHVNYFSKRSMEFLLQKTGFGIITVKTYGLSNLFIKSKKNVTKKHSIKERKSTSLQKFIMNILFGIPMGRFGEKVFFYAKK